MIAVLAVTWTRCAASALAIAAYRIDITLPASEDVTAVTNPIFDIP